MTHAFAGATLGAAWLVFALALVVAASVPARAANAPQASARTWHAYQRDFHFQHLDNRNGLVQDTVSVIFQDPAGYMWLATQGGLFRYDGYSVQRFTHDPAQPDSLPGNFMVTALAGAGHGRLWVGSYHGGLSLFDPATGKVLTLPASVQRRNESVTALLRLPDGSVLVGTPAGLDRVAAGPHWRRERVWSEPHGQHRSVRHLTRCPDGTVYAVSGKNVIALPQARDGRVLVTGKQSIQALFCSAQGKLLVGTAAGLSRMDRHSGAATAVWRAKGGKPVGVNAIVADERGDIWLGLDNHCLLRIGTHGSHTFVRPAPIGINGGLPDSRITTLLVDRDDMLWVGTLDDGVVWARSTGSPIKAVLKINGNAPARPYVRVMAPATHGRVWIAMNGRVLARYDPATHTFTGFGRALTKAVRHDPAAPASALAQAPGYGTQAPLRIYHLFKGADGALLVASSRGILRLDATTNTAAYVTLDGKPARMATRLLFRARNGDLWTAPFSGGLVHYHAGRSVQHFDADGGLGSNFVLAIAEDAKGRIWAGTTDGVSVLDPATGKVRTFREIPGHKDSLAGRVVASLLVTRDGHVWVGTLSGISELQGIDADGAHFKRFAREHAVPDNTVNCMLEDAAGHIWFSTNLGVDRLDPRTGRLASFGLDDGIQGNEYNQAACVRTDNGKLLFGGQGFDMISPGRIFRHDNTRPVIITSLYAGGKPVPAPTSSVAPVDIGAGYSSLYATVATLTYGSPGHNRFRYRLLGHNPHWGEPTTTRAVAYTDIAPGQYQLQVQTIGRDGVPGTATSVGIDVAYLWWARPSMRVLYAVVVLLAILAGVLGWRRRNREQALHRDQLRLRESRLRQALWGSGDQFWDWNLAHGTMLRLGPDGGPGGHREQSLTIEQWRRDMVHPDDLSQLDQALDEHLAGKSEHFEVEHRVRTADGSWAWVISRGRMVEHDAAGRPLRICGTERNISALRAADRERRIAAEVIRNMSEAVSVTDLAFRFVSVNTAFTRMTGYAADEVMGRDAALLDSQREPPENHMRMREELVRTGHWRGELWQRRKNDEDFLCWVELNEVRDAAGKRTHLIGVLTDITDRKRNEQELRYLANYDTLTGLPNRTQLTRQLQEAVNEAGRAKRKVALLFLDLDRFKHVNDSLGHGAGDRTLNAAGERLRECARAGDSVARLGGDEFTVVLNGLADVHAAEEMAQRLLRAFAEPLRIGEHQETVITPSIGIALYPDHGDTPAELLKCADAAMYQAKERGRNTYAVYNPGMDARARDHVTLITALRHALDRNELRVVYQPKMRMQDGVITGMEALLRWHHPELGDIAPATFIPLAEETGLIHEVGDYVTATACAALARFTTAGHAHLTMAINLSAAQLNRPDLPAHICAILAEQGVAPTQIELELTESMVMANADQSVRLLGELKATGARLAIDDFGTGYSSLAYLKRLPIDTLKIDQEFVGDITTDADDAAITETIITMAHSLQVRVVAEGVETAGQYAFLHAQQCDEIQGYWVSRPLSAENCLAFLGNRDAPAGTST